MTKDIGETNNVVNLVWIIGPSSRHNNVWSCFYRIFVNTKDPLLPLTQAQIDTLAYADCHAEGMMGDDCMTGTTVAGYGTRGSMRGYPVSQEVKLADTP